MRNVIALLNGTDPTAKWCVICAHYDSRSSDPENPVESAPGADDDASGIAGVIEAAAVLSPYKFKSTIAFVALSGEGVGCQGSKHYAINATSNHMNISCVVDLDMIGYDPLNLSRLVVADYYDSLDIFKDMKAYNIDYSIGLQLEENTLGYANTDYRSFSAEGFPALMCIEKHFNPEHHLPTDTIDQLNPTFMTKVVSLTIATVASYAMVDYLVPSGETVAFVIVCSGINLIACAWIVGRLASEN